MILQLLGEVGEPLAGQGLDQLDGGFQNLLSLAGNLQVVKVCDRFQDLLDFSQQPAEMVVSGDGLCFLLEGFFKGEVHFQRATTPLGGLLGFVFGSQDLFCDTDGFVGRLFQPIYQAFAFPL
jgi:hypothetical protein